jgi:hypothetical protein
LGVRFFKVTMPTREQERRRGDALARELASTQNEVETLTARITAMTDARTEAEKPCKPPKPRSPSSDRHSSRSADEATPSRMSWHRPVRNSKRAKQQTAQALAIEHQQWASETAG